ncbi:alr0857 family protein [Merismopedia glauca]|uniref:Uncharacterized protein n=1 Tax=Merismopedia glauca CCAP 1448/3 TaxID=1296344 RepID=A0A2T1C6S6_9CYAN|nr:alr0857 family protein [Merismopedia glauca]PSB03868.1 hypothetical protein C7B64_06600 [Merismopedia glauca CCAP 1448/3]
MLKLTYTETGLHMELVDTSLDHAIASRSLLALSLGCSLHITPTEASFLLPAIGVGLVELGLLLHHEASSVVKVDDESIEVTLTGVWIAESPVADEGIFFAPLSDSKAESWIYKLWQDSLSPISSCV